MLNFMQAESAVHLGAYELETGSCPRLPASRARRIKPALRERVVTIMAAMFVVCRNAI